VAERDPLSRKRRNVETNFMLPANDELEPYLIYRIVGDQVECSVWQLKDGPMALALFLSGDSALAYHKALGLANEWKVFRPARVGLLQLVKAAVQGGILYAVLDPDMEKAKRIFDLQDIVASLGLNEE
jgi:hypothetical protein